ncbi:MAG: efflux RND transporter periplasmic adaptor subunit [Thiohalobacteraceae bacterium]
MKPVTRTRLLWAVVALAILAAVAGFSRSRALDAIAVEPIASAPIEVFGLGTLEARVLSRVGFALPGTLEQVYADHGDRVAAGTPLARLDAAAQTARVAKADAVLTQAEAAQARAAAQVRRAESLLAQRRQTRARQETLVRKGSVSLEAAEDARTAELVAEADLAVAREDRALSAAAVADAHAQGEIERVQLAQHELRAPYPALVVERLREPGAVLNPGETAFTLIDPESVWALAYVDEAQAGGLAVGQAARLRLRSLPQQTFTAEVLRIGIESDRVSEERRVYLRCMDCPDPLHLGEQVEVVITKRLAQNALLIPQRAAQGSQRSDASVWVIDAGRLHRRAVRLGDHTLDGRVEVLSGLEPGVLIAAEPSPDLRDGQRIRARVRERDKP